MISILRGDPAYPARLGQLSDPPARLFVRGALPPPGPSLAIVGARRASQEGRQFAEELACAAAQAGALIISGGALGVDAAAHAGALRGGGRTLVVLPSTVERPLPRSNHKLFMQLLDAGGALVSEYEAEEGKHMFSARNRIIAALADRVLVVEAAARSGTQHTVKAARALGRPLAAVTWGPKDKRGEGARGVFSAAGRPISCVEDLLEWMNLSPAAEPAPPLGVDAELWALLKDGPREVEWLSARLGVPLPQLMVRLSQAELMGALSRAGVGSYRRA